MKTKTTIQKVREWVVLLIGLAVMVFCAYAFYADAKDLWANEVDIWYIIGGFLLGILLTAQPGRLNQLFDLIFNKIKTK